MITNMKKEQGNSKPLIYIGVGTILLFIVLIYLGSQQNKKASVPLAGEELPVETAVHVQRGSLPEVQDPPTSGEHYGDGVAGPGVHNEPVEDGLLVHSLEHGAVILSYDPEKLDEATIGQLKSTFTEKFQGKKIMVPRSGMSVPIIMTSWGQILKLEQIDEAKMIEFMDTNNDHGPEKAPAY